MNSDHDLKFDHNAFTGYNFLNNLADIRQTANGRP